MLKGIPGPRLLMVMVKVTESPTWNWLLMPPPESAAVLVTARSAAASP